MTCVRCGTAFDPAGERPECSAVPGRRCVPGEVPDVSSMGDPELVELGHLDQMVAEPAPPPPVKRGPGRPRKERPTLTEAEQERRAKIAAKTAARAAVQPRGGERGNLFASSTTGVVVPFDQAVDWPAMRGKYVEGIKQADSVHWPTLDELSVEYGIPDYRVRQKASKEGWRAQRTAWQAQVEATRRQNRANALSQKGVNLDNAALDAAQLGLQLCFAKLQDIGARITKARSEAGPGDAARIDLDSLEQARLATAVDLWHKVGLRAIGDPETLRVELTGANGAPIEIASELRRDDPSRLAQVIAVLERAGLRDFGVDDAARTLAAHRGEDGSYSTDEAGS